MALDEAALFAGLGALALATAWRRLPNRTSHRSDRKKIVVQRMDVLTSRAIGI